jgi:hypothetical protein
VNRLYISNSKYLFITIIFFVVCGLALTQAYYNYKNSPTDFGSSKMINIELSGNTNNTIVTLGDSRAGAAFVPEILDKNIPGTKTYNLGSRGGGIYGMMSNVISSGKPFKLVVVCVSPASLFGSFAYDSIVNEIKPVNLSAPSSGNLFKRVNTKLISIFDRNFKFAYGFSNLVNLMQYGEIPHYFTRDGWESNIRFGSDVSYAQAYNYYGYKTRLLCNSGNIPLLENLKIEFLSSVNSLITNQKVIFIRLPVSSEMRQLENERFPWFDDFVSGVASGNNIKYLNNFSDSFMSDPNNDGSHLSHYKAIEFSEMISETFRQFIIY